MIFPALTSPPRAPASWCMAFAHEINISGITALEDNSWAQWRKNASFRQTTFWLSAKIQVNSSYFLFATATWESTSYFQNSWQNKWKKNVHITKSCTIQQPIVSFLKTYAMHWWTIPFERGTDKFYSESHPKTQHTVSFQLRTSL